jgi:hypothetical protein
MADRWGNAPVNVPLHELRHAGPRLPAEVVGRAQVPVPHLQPQLLPGMTGISGTAGNHIGKHQWFTPAVP